MRDVSAKLLLVVLALACSSETPPPGGKDAGGTDTGNADRGGGGDAGGSPDVPVVSDGGSDAASDLPALINDANPGFDGLDAISPAPDAAGERPAGDLVPRPDGGVTGATWMYNGCNQAAIMYPRIDSNNGRFPPGSCPPPETLKPVCPNNSKIAVMVATASNFETAFPHPPAYAIDEHLTTRWSTNPGPTGWIQLDLGTEKTFKRLYLLWELAHGSGYDIVVSNNAQTWTPVTQVRGGDGFQDILEVEGTGRYIRMNGITRGSTGNHPQCCAAPGTLHGYALFDFTVCAETD